MGSIDVDMRQSHFLKVQCTLLFCSFEILSVSIDQIASILRELIRRVIERV